MRWLLVLAVGGLVLVAGRLPVPPLDPRLPAVFADPWRFKLWVFCLAVATLLLGTHLVTSYLGWARAETVENAGETKYPEIDAAWQEITIQLSHARIDPTTQSLYLLIAPDEALAASVVDAAGLTLFADGPASPESPIHCYAVADALLLTCSGASSLGGGGTDQLEYLCSLLTAATPETPMLRGIAVLLPFDWASGPDPIRRSAPVRDDIQTIRRAFQVRCPILTIFCMNESMPGFTEFAARLPRNLRQSRCGFSVPSSLVFGPEITHRGMSWMVRWFQSWSLHSMVQDIKNQEGNSRLLGMNATFQQNKDVLAAMLEVGMTLLRHAEPVFFRGCYFVACAPQVENQAFAAGLLRGKKGRLMADSELVSWSLDADRSDVGYRRACLAIAGVVFAVCLPVWKWAIFYHLSQAESGKSWLGWLGLALIALTWAVVLGLHYGKGSFRNRRFPAAFWPHREG